MTQTRAPERSHRPPSPQAGRCLLFVAMTLVLGSGCIFLDGTDDTVDGGYAPIVESSFPADSGSQLVPTDSFLSFSVAGSDPDSLYLEWDWQLDGELLALGSSDDGSYDSALELPWTADLSGDFGELRFAVTDGRYETDLYWSLSFE